ncbi:MAG: beta-ketoacyl synthase N-terminal-like domain-containing protein [Nostoc sp.]|uniref:type I polyketide synthase n=1 Tax=Nostoc sp. TaxID=1180 RepID=UPI002FEFB5C7
MNSPIDNINNSISSQRILAALKDARTKLEAVELEKQEQIAIIGIAGRFPGARSVDEFWHNIKNGIQSIELLTDEELLAAGVKPEELQNPNYVRRYASFPGIDEFDAGFFGYSPREAEILDPQHRLFLECAWEALENAGYDSEQYSGAIAVYAGAALNSYLVNLYSNPNYNTIDPVQVVVSNVMGLMPTRVSYKLNLTGPSCGVQTGCSTSLVSVHLACQSLLHRECDMALAGGVSLGCGEKTGYLYKENGVLSPDGYCRAFDVNAKGTAFGNGMGIVVLKRLRDAISDRDYIYAIIKGTAINNDGSQTVGLTAPSVSGQAHAIATAISKAKIEPETIQYIETHGTGTALGDPIEIAALTKVFSQHTNRKQFCAIGSVKTNIGHLDAAAGVTGLIKVALALKNEQIPPSLNFTTPNSQIDFANSPFFVNTHLTSWANNGVPRRAGVSSFGMGGTNAHAILEQAPTEIQNSSCASSAPKVRLKIQNKDEIERPLHLLTLSAKTPSALEVATANLATYLQVFLEVGFGQTLSTIIRQFTDAPPSFASGRHPQDTKSDVALICQTLGQLWLSGVTVNWSGFYAQQQRQKLPLPTYPFERQRYWVDRHPSPEVAPVVPKKPQKQEDMSNWFYLPSWKRSPIMRHSQIPTKQRYLVFCHADGIGEQLVQCLQEAGQQVITVTPGAEFTNDGDTYTIAPDNPKDYETLWQQLQTAKTLPNAITHLWTLTDSVANDSFEQRQILGFYSLLWLTQALSSSSQPLRIYVLTQQVQNVLLTETLNPTDATILGLCKVIPQEYPHLICQNIDLENTALHNGGMNHCGTGTSQNLR